MAKTTAPRASKAPPLMRFGDTFSKGSADAHGKPWSVKGRSVTAGKLPDACTMEGGSDDYAARRQAGLSRIRGS